MRERIIRVSPFKFLSILSCNITKEINKHAIAEIEGIIEEEQVDKYMDLGVSDTWVDISIEDENSKKETVFCGMIKDCSISADGGLNKLKLSLISGTFLMDIVEKTKTYQDKNMTYNQLISGIKDGYDASFIMGAGDGSSLGDLIVQYKETDWSFIKRLAGHFNSCIIPEATIEGIKFYFGVTDNGPEKEIESTTFSINKSVEEYVNKARNKVNGINEIDSISYIVESREANKICDNVRFKGKSLYVYSIKSYLSGNELIHKYELKSKKGFTVIKEFNNKIIGASLPANIIDVKNDTVKVSVKIDGGQQLDTARWFPYSTVYSSPDGSGWYCMPEKGDEVRLYFPSEKEKHGYIISSVHLSSGDKSARSNPNNKSIKSKYGKEVLLTDNSIAVTNNKGMSVIIKDDEGISIISDKAINIKSDEAINIFSMNDSLNMIAANSIKLAQGENKLELENDVKLLGSQVKIE